jgi:membrane-associated phospholipid phosphatase
MNPLDSGILTWLNQFAGRSPVFDSAVQGLVNSRLLQGELFMLVLWWLWFAPAERRKKNREVIVVTIAAALISLCLGRLFASFLPFRIRPAFNPELSFRILAGTNLQMRSWSSFPSDHAMLFAAVATGLLFISPRIAVAAYIYALLLIDLPRVYLGLHYPTDVLLGALFGTAVAWVLCSERVRSSIAARPLEFLRQHESPLYAFFFCISVEIATMFSEPRAIVGSIAHLAKIAR